ncbi:hypothetical protein I7I48_04667 [Histoplasma ohiense]|nr:hypothetical protein I7I48_04667 [Histoplasma ohiense (nom. inval.)]
MISTAAPPAAASAASASLPLLARRGLADFKQWIQPLIGSSQGVRLGVTRGLQLTARRLGTTHHHPSPPSQKSPPWGGEGEMCGWACFVCLDTRASAHNNARLPYFQPQSQSTVMRLNT